MSATSTTVRPVRARVTALSGIGFLAGYLVSDSLTGVLADRSLPLPDASDATAAAWFADFPGAAVLMAGAQLVSALFLVAFAGYVGRTLSRLRRTDAPRVALVGRLAAATMVLCALLGLSLAALAGSVGTGVVGVLRDANFYTGGVLHVVLLGAFVLMAVRSFAGWTGLGRGARRFGYVAGTLAALSVSSLVSYYAMALLPIGRVLCMAWAIWAGVSMLRRAGRDTEEVAR